MRIPVPSHLELDKTLFLVNLINSLQPSKEYLFDFENLQWMRPFGMLFVSQAIRNLKSKYPSSEIKCINLNSQDATSYASYMAFFTACGFGIGNNPGFKPMFGSTYLPITYAEVKQIYSKDAIDNISSGLAQQLSQQNHGYLVDVLTYSFREIIRNVSEHSKSKIFAYCAQYWPRKDLVEMAILDTGIGLRRSLSPNPYLRLHNDQDALKYALMPGISGKMYEGVKIRPDDLWQNSGYGLYMNYRLCNEGGSFFICSGSKALYRTKDQDNNIYHDIGFEGTALRLRLNTKRLRNIEEMIKQFGDEGEAMAKQVGMGAIPRASTMSRMLKNNFKTAMPKVQLGDTVKHKQYGQGVVSESIITPQGEMLWVAFSSRRKKVLRKDVIIINIDDYIYHTEDIDIEDSDDDVISADQFPEEGPYDSSDSFFDF